MKILTRNFLSSIAIRDAPNISIHNIHIVYVTNTIICLTKRIESFFSDCGETRAVSQLYDPNWKLFEAV